MDTKIWKTPFFILSWTVFSTLAATVTAQMQVSENMLSVFPEAVVSP